MPLFRKSCQKEAKFQLNADVLNYTPAAYQISSAWAKFLSSIEGHMREVLTQTSPDELNSDMFDAFIEAAAREVRTDALRQKTEHIGTILHDQKVLLGNLAEVRTLRRDLDGALAETVHQLTELGVHTAAHSGYEEVPE